MATTASRQRGDSISTGELAGRLGRARLECRRRAAAARIQRLALRRSGAGRSHRRRGRVSGRVALASRRRRVAGPARKQGHRRQRPRSSSTASPTVCRSSRAGSRSTCAVTVRSYEAGWTEWSADEALPVERLANYEQLVHPAWLQQLLDGGTPEAAPSGRFLLFHVNFGVPGGVRRQPSARRALPRHQPARERPRLESPLARGARRRRPLPRHHATTRP